MLSSCFWKHRPKTFPLVGSDCTVQIIHFCWLDTMCLLLLLFSSLYARAWMFCFCLLFWMGTNDQLSFMMGTRACSVDLNNNNASVVCSSWLKMLESVKLSSPYKAAVSVQANNKQMKYEYTHTLGRILWTYQSFDDILGVVIVSIRLTSVFPLL